MSISIDKKFIYILLVGIILLASFLRIYKITEVPPSLSWDEASVGYNAYSIANFGVDEWGKKFPLVFISFRDYKHPVHIYLTALFVKILGLSDFSTRLPSAVFGILNVILIFFLAKKLFKNDLVSLLASLLLAISPYNIQFSRFNHELNFAIFFFMLGVLLFYKSLEKKYFFAFSFISFGISFITYHSAKFVVPILSISLILLYFQKVNKFNKHLFFAIFVILSLIILIFLNPNLLGLERLRQSSFNDDVISKTVVYKHTHNQILGKFEIVTKQYFSHFSPKYLFISGDQNPRHSTQIAGEFLKIESVSLLIGALSLIWLILHKKNKEALFVLIWALISPIPSAFVNEAPHAARAMFTTGSWHLVSAYGFWKIFDFLKKPFIKGVFFVVVGILVTGQMYNYLNYYYREYPKKYAIEWQYGMREIVDFVKNNNYRSIYTTNIRQQPYIFYLYYLKYSPLKFLKEALYTTDQTRTFNTINSFGKFNFEWNIVESGPSFGTLYVVTPSEYTGIRHISSFDVKKVIKYPDGGDAFYLISAKVEDL